MVPLIVSVPLLLLMYSNRITCGLCDILIVFNECSAHYLRHTCEMAPDLGLWLFFSLCTSGAQLFNYPECTVVRQKEPISQDLFPSLG